MVKEIATINNVDLLKIRNMMLEKWICKTGPAVTKVCITLTFALLYIVLYSYSQFLFVAFS